MRKDVNLHLDVRPESFDTGVEIERLAAMGGGAVASFTGYVRADGADFQALELETYPAMARKALEEIGHIACTRWELLGVTLIHRYGMLTAGAPIVFVGAASRHRQAGLEACAFLIDWAKVRAPFWKRSWKKDGSASWVAARNEDDAKAQAWLQD